MNPDAPTILAMIVCAGMLARWIRNLDRENKRLAANEKLARDCMRDAIANRDEVVKELWELKAEHGSLLETAVELQADLDEYRRDDAVWCEVRRVVAAARAN